MAYSSRCSGCCAVLTVDRRFVLLLLCWPRLRPYALPFRHCSNHLFANLSAYFSRCIFLLPFSAHSSRYSHKVFDVFVLPSAVWSGRFLLHFVSFLSATTTVLTALLPCRCRCYRLPASGIFLTIRSYIFVVFMFPSLAPPPSHLSLFSENSGVTPPPPRSRLLVVFGGYTSCLFCCFSAPRSVFSARTAFCVARYIFLFFLCFFSCACLRA